jgi:PAS domain S-box-containing protein
MLSRDAEVKAKPDFYDIFKKHSAIMLLIDAKTGAIVDANQSAADYYGYSIKQLSKMKISDINVRKPTEVKGFMALADSEFRNYFIFRHRKSSGEIRDVEVYSSPIIYKEQEFLFSIIHDITDRVFLEKSLRDSNELLQKVAHDKTKEASELEARFQSIFENAGIGILLLENDGTIIDSNPAFSLISKRSKELLKGSRLSDLFGGKEVDMFSRVGELDFVQFERSLKLSDKESIPLDIMVSPVKNDENVSYLLCIVEDISYKKNIEKKQREQEALLVQQSKMAAMGEMIGAIAHQWRQPLNALGLMIQDLKSAYEYGEFNEAYLAEMIERSMGQIHFMSSTIDSFRSFFKPSKEKEFFSLSAAAEDVLSMLSTQLKNNNIKVILELDEHNSDVVYGFKNEFKQVVLNILSNAKDAILDKNNSGTIYIGSKIKNKNVHLSFLDTGGGIADDVIDKVFEPYFSTKEQGKGTGIGLYMSKIIIEEHMGGKLLVKNKNGGALFEIVLGLASN